MPTLLTPWGYQFTDSSESMLLSRPQVRTDRPRSQKPELGMCIKGHIFTPTALVRRNSNFHVREGLIHLSELFKKMIRITNKRGKILP